MKRPVSSPTSRRDFLKTSAAGSLALAAPAALAARRVAKPSKADSETLVAQLYKSLNEEQRKQIEAVDQRRQAARLDQGENKD